ncbi:MAG: hydantoinase B/oxoprolinase family protein [Candidatus Methylomirabilia bacterium]
MKDLVTVEVVRNQLLAAAEEIGIILVRTAYSPNIKERRDSSAAILAPDGSVIAQASHIPIHLSSMMELGPELTRYYPSESLRPGDMFIANDPYVGAGSHLNDVAVIAPVFVAGELVAFVANTAHHADIGGRVPGSESGDSRTIFQDGLRIPVARILHRGRLDDGLFRTILLNSRTPEERVGDLRAQFAANRAGTRRIEEIARRYGSEALAQCMDAIVDYTERRIREGIRSVPSGTYTASGYTDDNGLEPQSVAVRLAVHVRDNEMLFDFSGTDPQIPGAKNVPLVSLLATVYYVVRAVIDPDIPSNTGLYRAIAVRAPRGSVLNPVPPAAVAARFTTCQKVADVILTALAAAVPDRVVAHCHGGTLAIYSGTDARTGELFVDYEVYAGGSGARFNKDGADGVANHTTNTSNLPIECLEQEFPLLVERYELRPDSGGPGRCRGGLGVIREVRGLDRELTVGGWGCDQRVPPRGLATGRDGAPGSFEFHSHGSSAPEIARSTVAGARLPAGGRLRIATSGGGGFGNPLDREPGHVLRDVLEGKITPVHARSAYGVVTRGQAVDLVATERLRRHLREGSHV